MREITQEALDLVCSKAQEIRRNIITMLGEAGSGHTGGSLSAADILACLYFWEMQVDPKRPGWEDRDRFVL
ncbi:MAG: transketolase, partial [Syntrophomonadaceae bacterium]|nr:transketolase [Syntrophomonadaceae bacterium]